MAVPAYYIILPPPPGTVVGVRESRKNRTSSDDSQLRPVLPLVILTVSH
jgi:hypothetical protein